MASGFDTRVVGGIVQRDFFVFCVQCSGTIKLENDELGYCMTDFFWKECSSCNTKNKVSIEPDFTVEKVVETKRKDKE